MPLSSGTMLAHYEVAELLGAGGMGEVYRARDTKLGRDVALKLLATPLAGEAELLERFEREARLLASVNHPHIATLHGLEEDNGVHFLVMELVEGQTLGVRIAKGRLSTGEALQLFRRIADALEKAHEKGVVHRDLKPANIMITPEGEPKVLDFGLAKAFGPQFTAETKSESPTMTREGTASGVILGTAAYMSPEQARGKPLDKRTDIWSFGCVLYEALRGKPAFRGETVSDTIAAILKSEPDLESLPRGTPAVVRRLVSRCLVKDPRRRWRDMGDVGIELEDAVLETPGPTSAEHSDVSKMTAITRASLGLAVLFAGIALWSLTRPTERARGELTRTVIPLPADVTLARNTSSPDVAISPDGRQVALIGTHDDVNQLYLRSLDSLETRTIDGTEGAAMPFFSPDGEWVGFHQNGTLMKVSIRGSAPVKIADAGAQRGASWGPSDEIVFTTGSTAGLSVIGADGGAARGLTGLDRDRREKTHRLPEVLSSGAVLFTLGTPDISLWDEGSVAVYSPETGQHRVLIEQGRNATYSPSGHIVYAYDGNLFAVPFDLESLETRGAPVRVVEGVMTYALQGQAEFSLSRSGSLVYAAGTSWGVNRKVVLVDHQGQVEPLIETRRAYLQARTSPDGRQLALDVEGANRGLWIYDFERGIASRLPFGYDSMHPVWSPSGDKLVFDSSRTGAFRLFLYALDEHGEGASILESGDLNHVTGSWSVGDRIAFNEIHAETGYDLWTVRMEGSFETEPFLRTQFNERRPMFSPDGRWIAYESDESGPFEVYLRPFPAGEPKLQVSTNGGTQPAWNPNGGELFYREGDTMMVVTVRQENGLDLSRPRALFDRPSPIFDDPIWGVDYDVSADGRSFIMIDDSEDVQVTTQLVLVQNFAEELNRLVPADR